MCGTKSCAILGHSPMRFAWGFDEEAAECHDILMWVADMNPACLQPMFERLNRRIHGYMEPELQKVISKTGLYLE